MSGTHGSVLQPLGHASSNTRAVALFRNAVCARNQWHQTNGSEPSHHYGPEWPASEQQALSNPNVRAKGCTAELKLSRVDEDFPKSGWTHGSGPFRCFGGGDRRSALGFHKLWPDVEPGALAKSPTPKLPLGLGLQLHGPGRVHVAKPGQALVEVGLTHTGRLRQSAADFWGDFSTHANQCSDSLEGCKAIRYGLTPSDLLELRHMETSNERRKRKLDELCKANGGLDAVAAAAQVSPVYLDQILEGRLLPPKKDGTRSPRSLGDDVARKLEKAFALETGWFDDARPDTTYKPTGSVDEPARPVNHTSSNFTHDQVKGGYAELPQYEGWTPVVAVAKVGESGFYEEQLSEVAGGEGWVPRFGTGPVYAVRVKGDGLAPTFRNGSFLLVGPEAELDTNEEVVIGFMDGRKAVRLLLKQGVDTLSVAAVGGGSEQTIDLEDVAFVHAIVGLCKPSQWQASLEASTVKRQESENPGRKTFQGVDAKMVLSPRQLAASQDAKKESNK